MKKLILLIALLLAPCCAFGFPVYQYCGAMFMYESDGTVTVDVQNKYIQISDEDWQAGDLNGFTFSEGRTVDANVTNEVDNTVLQIDTSAAHNLTTGDIVTVHNANNALHNEITAVTVVDADTFDCDNINFVGNAGVSSAKIYEGAYLQYPNVEDHMFLLIWCNNGGSAAANKAHRTELRINAVELDQSAGEMSLSGTTLQGNCGVQSTTLSAGDRISMTIRNTTDTQDFLLEHINLTVIYVH